MGVIIVAVMPTSVPMRDSLEACVLWKMKLNIATTPAATSPAQITASGALTHGLLVAGIL